MIYLDPPLHMIDGISVFRDHADPLQWYYLPVAPHVTLLADPVTDALIPQLQVIRFRGTAGSGGFLNFDVDLGINPDRLDEVAREIKSLESLPDRPRLAPVPLVDGSVKLLLFDHVEPEEGEDPPPATGPTELDRFVLTAQHAAKPSLYGENRAAFSAQLSQRGVTILEQAMLGEMSPIGVVYSLEFLALRPAYHVHVNVEWDRVQHHLEEHFKVSVPLVFQSQIDEIVDELIETQLIEINVDTFVLEGGDESGGVIARRDEAVNDVRDMITESFFQPSLDPMPRQDDTQNDLDKAQRVIQMITTGGMGGGAAFSYNKSDITRIDKKRLNVNMKERTTVKRTIYPQGHLTGLFRLLRDQNVDLDRFIISVDTDDPWFERRKVQVIPRADFPGDAIQSLNVHLDYNGQPQNVVLDANSTPADLDWPSLIVDGAMQRPVKTRFDVNFAGIDGTERPTKLTSEEVLLEGDNLEVIPRSLYSLVDVPILALNFPWDRYSHVEVHTKYSDPENEIDQVDQFMLKQDRTEANWKMFVRNRERTEFSWKVIYRGVDHQDEERSWVVSEDEQIVLRDPFPNKRSLSVVPAVNWTLVDRIFVDLSYNDEANHLSAEESFEFNETDKVTKTFRVSLADSNQRLISYRVTIIGKDGTVTEVPPSATFERRITVREDLKGHRIIQFGLEGGDFDTHNVREVKVEARYEDPANRLSFTDSLVMRSANKISHFEFDYVEGGTTNFEYRVIRLFTNGLTRETDWISDSENILLLSVSGS